MQESVFQFSERPFSADIRVDRYFPAEVIEHARLEVARTIERAEGCSLVVGPAGSGKTMLCQVLAEQFREDFEPVVLSGGRLPSRKALLQAILFELSQPYRRMDEGELRLALMDYLSPREGSSRGMLLLADEAHTLSPKLIEELRLLTNLVRQGSPRVRLVLAGGAILEERFANPKMASFNQRITCRSYLEPFSSAETQQFVRAQLAAAGGQPDRIFTDKGLRAIHHATDGVPRLINQLCDHVLLLASAGTKPGTDAPKIDERGVEEAWADLQQLPMPWNTDDAVEAIAEESSQAEVEFSPDEFDEGDMDAGELIAADELSQRGSEGQGSSSSDMEDDFDDEFAADLGESIDPSNIESNDDVTDSNVVEERESVEGTLPFVSADAPIADPSEQLDQIEQQVRLADEEFRPAGSIGPQTGSTPDREHDLLADSLDDTRIDGAQIVRGNFGGNQPTHASDDDSSEKEDWEVVSEASSKQTEPPVVEDRFATREDLSVDADRLAMGDSMSHESDVVYPDDADVAVTPQEDVVIEGSSDPVYPPANLDPVLPAANEESVDDLVLAEDSPMPLCERALAEDFAPLDNTLNTDQEFSASELTPGSESLSPVESRQNSVVDPATSQAYQGPAAAMSHDGGDSPRRFGQLFSKMRKGTQ